MKSTFNYFTLTFLGSIKASAHRFKRLYIVYNFSSQTHAPATSIF